jgi:glucokinase
MFRELHDRCYVYRLTTPRILQPDTLEENKTYVLKAHLGTTAGLLGACLLGLEQPSTQVPFEEDQLVNQ